MKRPALLIICCALSGILAGCGYTTKTILPKNLRTIHVEPFKNSIDFTGSTGRNLYLPLLEVDVRNAVIDRFLFDGNLKVAEADQADLVLKGELIGYNRSGLRYSDDEDVQEYRVRITVSLEMFNTQTGLTSWVEPSFAGEATYFVSGSQATTEQSAIDAAIEDLARRIVERTIEDW